MVFVNELSPFLVRVPGTEIGIRWYGLAYVLGFVLTYFTLRNAVRAGRVPGMGEKQIEPLMYALMAGVIVGGRLGYVVQNLDDLAKDPLFVFKFNQGGMAFFGGLAGVVLAIVWFCRWSGLKFGFLGDVVTVPTAISLGIGRIANFINGELWGIPTGAEWGVVYPRSPGPQVPRHPSELYEMASHFALAGLLVLAYRVPGVRARRGMLSCVFVAGYGFFRFFTEIFRETSDYWGPITNGQGASLIILLIGLICGGLVWRKGPTTVEGDSGTSNESP